ncbi:uncharacterized protein LOC131234986 [Magnolia sinica]|uniref:uncharacterized protein LOC131234986 n=1 Tax=Magnolia sinica TaxID=86752 RepID=UPI00265A52C4|nr:uncharacterized protein LOC131234986 [Magnolia sinica]
MGHTTEKSRAVTARRSRFVAEEASEPVECSCETIRSCSVGLVADCIAVCCCPCAVVNVMILALVKVPWTVGRRCMRLLKKKEHLVEKKKGGKKRRGVEREEVKEKNGNFEKEVGVERGMEFSRVDEEGGASFEAERVWMELYQLGHLGFGRVSFTGIHHVKGI